MTRLFFKLLVLLLKYFINKDENHVILTPLNLLVVVQDKMCIQLRNIYSVNLTL